MIYAFIEDVAHAVLRFLIRRGHPVTFPQVDRLKRKPPIAPPAPAPQRLLADSSPSSYYVRVRVMSPFGPLDYVEPRGLSLELQKRILEVVCSPRFIRRGAEAQS